VPLTEVAPGSKVIIRRVHELAEETPELLSFLEDNGIVLGKEAEVIDYLKFNQTITLQVRDHTVTLGFQTAKYLFVELASEPEQV
jgi:Fe2+ transport system protein FeoA